MVELGIAAWSSPLSVDATTPFTCRVGGSPCYFESPPPPPPTCGACASPLFLLLQLYAPAERARALLVFVCNSSACPARGGPGGGGAWLVRRSQGGATASLVTTEPAETLSQVPAPLDPWGASNAWGDGAGAADGGGWGEPPAAVTGACEAAVESVGAVAAAAPVSAPRAPAVVDIFSELASLQVDSVSPVSACVFPAFALDTGVYEPPNELGEEGDSVDSESDTDDEGASGAGARGPRISGGGTATRGSWSYSEQLFAAYRASEEAPVANDDPALVAAAAAALALGDDDADDAAAAGVAQGGGSADTAAGGDGGGGERYERTPAKERFWLRFQKRLARCPQQVLRYIWALGDEGALWPVPPPPLPRERSAAARGRRTKGAKGAAVATGVVPPACEACGGPRRLELQVLPSILAGLGVEDHTAEAAASRSGSTTAATAPADLAHALQSGGVDFASAFVYCCEASCDEGTTEWVWTV